MWNIVANKECIYSWYLWLKRKRLNGGVIIKDVSHPTNMFCHLQKGRSGEGLLQQGRSAWTTYSYKTVQCTSARYPTSTAPSLLQLTWMFLVSSGSSWSCFFQINTCGTAWLPPAAQEHEGIWAVICPWEQPLFFNSGMHELSGSKMYCNLYQSSTG